MFIGCFMSIYEDHMLLELRRMNEWSLAVVVEIYPEPNSTKVKDLVASEEPNMF